MPDHFDIHAVELHPNVKKYLGRLGKKLLQPGDLTGLKIYTDVLVCAYAIAQLSKKVEEFSQQPELWDFQGQLDKTDLQMRKFLGGLSPDAEKDLPPVEIDALWVEGRKGFDTPQAWEAVCKRLVPPGKPAKDVKDTIAAAFA